MNTLHIPTPQPGITKKTPLASPNVEGNPGDGMSLPGDKPIGEEQQVLDDEGAPDVNSDADTVESEQDIGGKPAKKDSEVE